MRRILKRDQARQLESEGFTYEPSKNLFRINFTDDDASIIESSLWIYMYTQSRAMINEPDEYYTVIWYFKRWFEDGELKHIQKQFGSERVDSPDKLFKLIIEFLNGDMSSHKWKMAIHHITGHKAI